MILTQKFEYESLLSLKSSEMSNAFVQEVSFFNYEQMSSQLKQSLMYHISSGVLQLMTNGQTLWLVWSHVSVWNGYVFSVKSFVVSVMKKVGPGSSKVSRWSVTISKSMSQWWRPTLNELWVGCLRNSPSCLWTGSRKLKINLRRVSSTNLSSSTVTRIVINNAQRSWIDNSSHCFTTRCSLQIV